MSSFPIYQSQAIAKNKRNKKRKMTLSKLRRQLKRIQTMKRKKKLNLLRR